MRLARVAAALLAVALIAAVPGVADAVERWQPATSDRLHIQLSGQLRVPAWATFVEVDGAETTAATVADLHARGLRVACYISAGSAESYRHDIDRLPARVVGKRLDGWPDERWLDTRRIDLLAPVMRARITMCASKGFDAIEFDNVDGWVNDTGFPLTRADSLRYLRWLTSQGHAAGLAVGLKNALGAIAALADRVDWALNEQCVEYDECHRYAPLGRRGVPVFVVEYTGSQRRVCSVAHRWGLIAQRKHLNLGAWSHRCDGSRSERDFPLAGGDFVSVAGVRAPGLAYLSSQAVADARGTVTLGDAPEGGLLVRVTLSR